MSDQNLEYLKILFCEQKYLFVKFANFDMSECSALFDWYFDGIINH